jgi:hypothetical protein
LAHEPAQFNFRPDFLNAVATLTQLPFSFKTRSIRKMALATSGIAEGLKSTIDRGTISESYLGNVFH